VGDEEHELSVDPELRPGVWANWSRVREGSEEFIIDLACADPDENDVEILVARIRCSPRVAKDLAEAIDKAWRRYARWALPKEVIDADPEFRSEQADDQGEDGSD
jgi:hypothetical protein